jgi:hypothetical protein
MNEEDWITPSVSGGGVNGCSVDRELRCDSGNLIGVSPQNKI